jgi:hypothetical protein
MFSKAACFGSTLMSLLNVIDKFNYEGNFAVYCSFSTGICRHCHQNSGKEEW